MIRFYDVRQEIFCLCLLIYELLDSNNDRKKCEKGGPSEGKLRYHSARSLLFPPLANLKLIIFVYSSAADKKQTHFGRKEEEEDDDEGINFHPPPPSHPHSPLLHMRRSILGEFRWGDWILSSFARHAQSETSWGWEGAKRGRERKALMSFSRNTKRVYINFRKNIDPKPFLCCCKLSRPARAVVNQWKIYVNHSQWVSGARMRGRGERKRQAAGGRRKKNASGKASH